MNLHCETYRNQMNESIQLTIRQYRSSSSKCKITIRRLTLGVRWFLVRLLIYFAITQVVLVLLCFNRVQIRFLWSLCLFLLVALLLYIFSPVKEESIILFDNLNGIEYEKHFLFGRCTSTFINTNQIIINEGITMQRVIFYMVAIPICLQHLILNQEPDNESKTIKNKGTSSDEAFTNNLISESKLIPLFMSTLPRLDCLKVIYSHVIKYRQSLKENETNSTISTNSQLMNKPSIDRQKIDDKFSTSQMPNGTFRNSHINCAATSDCHHCQSEF